MSENYYNPAQSTMTLSKFMNAVYLWMAIGLGLSAAVAYSINSHAAWQSYIFHNPATVWVMFGLQLACVFGFRTVMRRCSTQALAALFLFYCLLTGLTFSVILLVYTQQTITQAFLATAGSFLALSIFGYTTKRDLGPLGHFCFVGLIGIIIASLLSWFMPSMRGYVSQMVISSIGVLVFAGLMAYDTQKIKQSYQQNQGTGFPIQKLALQGALALYLDFINLFLMLLRLFGGGGRR